MKLLPSTHTSRPVRAYFPAALALAGSILLSACGGSDSPSTGIASVDITDAPADDVTQVHLTVHRISLKPKSGSAFDYFPD